MCEYLRAWLFLQSGKSLEDLTLDIVPRDRSVFSPSPVDFEHVKQLDFYKKKFRSIVQPQAGEFLRATRFEIWADFLTLVEKCDANLFFHHTDLCAEWERSETAVNTLASLYSKAEDSFVYNCLRLPD